MSETDVNEMNRGVIAEFRASGGKVTGRFGGVNLLLLTTTGAKTGARRVNPLMYVMDGERFVIFASKRGAPTNPDWYHNLVTQPEVTVEVGGETFPARAVVTSAEERRRIFDAAALQYPFLVDLQAGTSRRIPVIALERAG